MSYTSTADEIRSGKWSIQDLVSLALSMMDEVESHILLKESLPDELFQGLFKTINDIEAEILRRRAALSLVQEDVLVRQAETPSSQSEWAQDIASIESPQLENSSGVSLTTDQGFIQSDTEHGDKDHRTVAGEIQDTLASLHDSIKAIQSVVLLRMNASLPSKTSTTSSMVSFSILEEEMEILDGLLKHVAGSCKPSDDESRDLLETKLVALPTLLGALFNMEIREAVDDGSDIDDKVMMQMVVANQRRTNVLRDIERIAKRVKDVAVKSKTTLER